MLARQVLRTTVPILNCSLKLENSSMLPNDVTQEMENGRVLRGKSALRLHSVTSSDKNVRRIELGSSAHEPSV